MKTAYRAAALRLADSWHSWQRNKLGVLDWSAVFVALLISIPVVFIVAELFAPSGETWRHLVSTVLPGYIINTLILLIGVASGVVLIGTTTAWLVTSFQFPGRRLFEWSLVLPLAMPAYVIAYAYTDALQFSGPVQTWLREATGWKARDYWFPEIRSMGGAIALFSLTLYPYVYLLARAAFLEQTLATLEAARLLGASRWGVFFRIALPLARPGIVAGMALAMMEALADFGTVSYFAVQTFSTGIYRAWFSLGDSHAAVQLSAVMLMFVLGILACERFLRAGARVHNTGTFRKAAYFPLRGAAARTAMLICLLPVVLGFLLPAGMLLRMALADGDQQLGWRFIGLIVNSFTLAAIAAVVAVAIAVLIAYAARISNSHLVLLASRIAGLGYALPGSVIAVGIMVPVAAFDNALSAWLKQQFGFTFGLLITGTVAAMVYAYNVRFLGVALQAVNAGMTKITPSMDDASRSLGLTLAASLRRVHLPMLRGSLLTAALIVFVDVMKELPATFVLRPFNFDTLAVQAYNLAADERLSEAATASLVIVLVGLLPVLIVSRAIRQPRLD